MTPQAPGGRPPVQEHGRGGRHHAGRLRLLGLAEGGTSDVKEAALGGRRISKRYSKEQRAFYTAHAPDGLGLDDLSVAAPGRGYPAPRSRLLLAVVTWTVAGSVSAQG